MALRLALLLLSAPLVACADPAGANQTGLEKGPIIAGVGTKEAWITWETSTLPSKCAPAASVLRLAPASHGATITDDGSCQRVRHAHVTGLAPATHYQVHLRLKATGGSGEAAGAFTTAPASQAAPFKFVVYGDNREPEDDEATTRPQHEALMAAIRKWDSDAAFVLQTGDLALNYPTTKAPERGYAEFFEVEHGLLVDHPIFAVLGNHDKLDTDEFDAFVNPRAFEKRPHRYYWSFDWGRAHFAIVDAFEGPPKSKGPGRRPGISPEQAAWLDADLKDASARGQVLFIASHHSPFSHIPLGGVGHGSSGEIAEVFVPLMHRYRVAAVLAGHDHFYMRGHEQCVDYVIVGSGGAPMYDPDAKAPGVLSAHKETAYLSVSVTADDIVATARNVHGEALDTFHFSPQDPTACVPSGGGH